MIEIKNLSAGYTKKSIFTGVSFSVPEEEFLGIVGPNGAGKSTLLKSMLGFIPSTGETLLGHKPLQKVRKSIAYVPQKQSVDWDFPITVFDAVLMGTYGNLGWFRRPGNKEKELTKKTLKTVEMYEYQNTQIGELSGGQRQRVFLARALVQESDILFLDEPFAGIDAVSEKLIFSVLKNLKLHGKTILVVHHNLGHIKEYFSSVLLFNRGIVSYGKTNQVFTKENIAKCYGDEVLVS